MFRELNAYYKSILNIDLVKSLIHMVVRSIFGTFMVHNDYKLRRKFINMLFLELHAFRSKYSRMQLTPR